MKFQCTDLTGRIYVNADKAKIVLEALKNFGTLHAKTAFALTQPFGDEGRENFHESVFGTIENTEMVAMAELK